MHNHTHQQKMCAEGSKAPLQNPAPAEFHQELYMLFFYHFEDECLTPVTIFTRLFLSPEMSISRYFFR